MKLPSSETVISFPYGVLDTCQLHYSPGRLIAPTLLLVGYRNNK